MTYTFTALNFFSPYATFASDITSNGIVVGYSGNGQSWTYDPSTSAFTLLPASSLGTIYAEGLNASGQIVGLYYPGAPADYQAFLYSAGSYADFRYTNAGGGQFSQTYALGINDSGEIVGSYLYYYERHAFAYSGGTFTDLQSSIGSAFNISVAFTSLATAVNNAGVIIGNYGYVDPASGQSVQHAFIDSAGTFVQLDVPNATSTTVSGINDSGEIVGQYFDAAGAAHGFTDVGGTFTTIDYPSNAASNTNITGVDNAGDIVGTYYDSATSTYHSFFATPADQSQPTIILQPGSEGSDLWIANWYDYGSNFGVDDQWLTVVASRDINNGLRQQYSLVQFDLSNTNISGTITSATLRLYHYDNGSGPTSASMYVDEVHTPWTDAYGWYDYALSYSNLVTVSISKFGWIDIDVTSAVQDWLAHPNSNFGLQLRPAGESSVYGDWNYFVSFDATGSLAPFHPELVLKFGSPNSAPVASNIAADVNEDPSNGPVTLAASFIDPNQGDTFTFKTDTSGTIGQVKSNNDGTFTYDPNGKFEYLAVGETATDTFTYTVTDNHGASSTATATVTIHGENDTPTASPDVVAFQKGTTLTADAVHGVLANDHDPDIHDVLTVSAINGSAALVGRSIKGTYGTLALGANGSYTYVAKSNDPVGAQDVFQYTASDGHGGASNSTLTFQIPYPALVITAATLTGSLNERLLVTGSTAIDQTKGTIGYNVPDPLNRPTATVDLAHQTITWQDNTHNYTSELTGAQLAALAAAFSISQTDNATNGHVNWMYKIKDGALDFLSANETITITTPVLIDDHHGNVRTENVLVTVNGANDNPIAANDSISATGAGLAAASKTRGLLANDIDPDLHSSLSIDSVNGIALAGQPALGKYGALTFQADGSYQYAETANAVPKDAKEVFHYIVSDGLGGTDTATLTISVPALTKAANIFASNGGKIGVLATLAQDAYHLAPTEFDFAQGQGKNVAFPFAEHLFSEGLPVGMRFLSTTDLPLGLQNVPDTAFPTSGLEDGIYHNGNAAALVARSADSLFIAFRGTNDEPNLFQDVAGGFHSGTPDSNDWFSTGEQNYYALLSPLLTALDSYVSTHPDIQHVYVTGHSLGGGVTQEFMATHGSPYASSIYDAVTFGSIGFSSFASNQDDSRITNIHVVGDPSLYTGNYGNYQRGDDYQILDFNSLNTTFNSSYHHMELYYSIAHFLPMEAYAVPSNSLRINGHYDQTTIVADIINNGSPSDWTVALPSGVVGGTNGNDIIQAAPGFNILSGGAGGDRFVFTPNFGNAVITDFQPGRDTLQLDHSLFATANAALHAVTYGFDSQASAPIATVQVAANESIILKGIVSGLLHASDFQIV